MQYNEDILPKASLIAKLRYFFHPYNANFNCKRFMKFDEGPEEDDLTRELERLEHE